MKQASLAGTVARALAAAVVGSMLGSPAAAAGCAAVGKAGQLAQAQPRIHAITRTSVEGPSAGQATLLHSVVVGRVQTVVDGSHWSQNRLDADLPPSAPASAAEGMRLLAANLVYFDAELPCRPLGRETVAGRAAMAYEIRYEVESGEATGKLWLDTATGLPLKMTTRQKDFDLKMKLDRTGKLAGVQHRANDGFIVQQHAWLFGDAVKDLTRASKAPDAATQALIEALLR